MSLIPQIQQKLNLLALKDSFISDCLQEVQQNHSELLGDINSIIEHIYNIFLYNDIRLTSNPVLSSYSFDIKEDILEHAILQCDEYSDIGNTVDDQFNETKNRMMKLSLTDGTTSIYGFESNHIDSICMRMKPGFKVALRQVKVRRGVLYLNNSNIQVLGGDVEELVRFEEEKRSELERKYRPSYIPLTVRRTAQVPLGAVDVSEEESDDS
ncbi:hypothetical protein EDI_229040 [Entamoeba dispar SAW760]|uniref:RecQ-mediated genome instability protein 1 n=1 Tax=Entamoeba dispar (strain ATCC PRA-260 / SAW760) TaxID=370354 RepID=B0ELT3_ENTDS|nr:uncharacterized protein EDI_229040 [Entamoeba dispar SAW760]EDR24526.1 hypothetical protein EDI_229040 [Entamoeba dispar SAW760]|eukprot:EDR24526.1 hypothetical protein EDI_229040 [Entamoeba dispar SAW760]